MTANPGGWALACVRNSERRAAARRPRLWRLALPLVLTALTALPAPAAPCRQALAMGLDVSGSVDEDEYRLQLDGLAAALLDPQVAAILLAGGAPVRLIVYEWSGPTEQRRIAGWTEIDSAATLSAFAETLRQTGRLPASPSTALGTAMLTGAQLLAEQPGCWKRTLDLSGDGISNTGPRPQDLRERPEFEGITINALVVGDGEGGTRDMPADLMSYYRALVIRGPGAFAEPAADYRAYEAAMVKKLLRELEGLVVGAAEGAQ